MMTALYQVAKTLLEKTKSITGTLRLLFGNLLKTTTSIPFITPISYKNDKRHGLYFRMIMDMPVVMDIECSNMEDLECLKRQNTMSKP